MSKVYEYFKDKLENNGPQHPSEMEPKACGGCGEIHPVCYCNMQPEDDPVTNCCGAPFTYPGYPDSDFCSKCHEHAGVDDDE